MKYCKPLCDYAEFGKIVLQERKHNGTNFIESAVQKCVKADILAEYLVRKNKEVENMVFGEYDYAMDIAVQREEAWEEGVAVGIAENRVDIARNMMTRGFSANDISDITGLSLEEVKAL